MTISVGVVKIGKGAFDGCSGLISIVIPSSVTSIGSCAFAECDNLQNVVILRKKMTRIGEFAFKNCKSLHEKNICANRKNIKK